MNIVANIVAVIASAALLHGPDGDGSQVQIVGALRYIHKDGDARPRLRIDSVARKGVYGLGPVAQLKGEIVLLDGHVYTTRVGAESLETTTTDSTLATLFVWQHVPAWKQALLVTKSVSLDSIGTLVQSQLPLGKARTQPTIFRIDGVVESMSWHVVDWPDGLPIKSGNHLQYAYRDTTRSELVRCIGVWHPTGAGLVTHQNTDIHLHAVLGPDTVAVHVDDVRFAPGAMIMVPRN